MSNIREVLADCELNTAMDVARNAAADIRKAKAMADAAIETDRKARETIAAELTGARKRIGDRIRRGVPGAVVSVEFGTLVDHGNEAVVPGLNMRIRVEVDSGGIKAQLVLPRVGKPLTAQTINDEVGNLIAAMREVRS